MSRVMHSLMPVAALLLLSAALPSAQTQTMTTQVKNFEVIAVTGNDLVVKLPEGTREMNVPEDFRFNVDGQQMSVHQLKPGMKGTATITTRTTLHPVTVTEVKNGTVRAVSGSNIIVQTAEGFKAFSQSDVDKRGVKIVKDGQPAQLSDFRTGDQLSATIITTRPPRAVTEQEVSATLARSAAGGGAASSAGSPGTGGSSSAGRSASSALASSQTAGGTGTPSSSPRRLPKTASPLPIVGLGGVASLAFALTLTIARRRQGR